jgi:hypothetical protein
MAVAYTMVLRSVCVSPADLQLNMMLGSIIIMHYCPGYNIAM